MAEFRKRYSIGGQIQGQGWRLVLRPDRCDSERAKCASEHLDVFQRRIRLMRNAIAQADRRIPEYTTRPHRFNRDVASCFNNGRGDWI